MYNLSSAKHILIQTSKYFKQITCYSKISNHNLNELLITMPKSPKHVQEAQKQRQKIKDKSQKYVPGTVTLQVLGSGAEGAPRALYVFTDHSRYLFNCGEGTQRLAHEHKMKLSRLEHIFITQAVWANIGGLPGVSLTIQDVGVANINLHGPPGLDELFAATRRFVVLKDLSITMTDCIASEYYEDNVMTVRYIPITKKYSEENVVDTKDLSSADREYHPSHIKYTAVEIEDNYLPNTSTADFSKKDDKNAKSKQRRRSRSKSESQDESSEDDTDYYAHEKSGKRVPPPPLSHISHENREQNLVMNYICRLKPRPGMLCLEKCVEAGITPGPLLGRLKAGEDVVLSNGNVVRSVDVCLPDDPGPVFLVIDCPEIEYLDSLISRSEWTMHQATANKDEDVAIVVIHFTPSNVMMDERYRNWVDKFSPSTQHLALNDNGSCMGSSAVYRVQNQLNLLDSNIFPLLHEQYTLQNICSYLNTSQPPVKKIKVDHVNMPLDQTNSTNTEILMKSLSVDSRSSSPVLPMLQQANTLWSIHLRPRKGIDRSNEIILNRESDIAEVMDVEDVCVAIQKLKPEIDAIRKKLPCEEYYPHFLFLGTGSCIPNKTRNTSGILIQTSKDSYILFDCGEGTFGQLVRYYGKEGVISILNNLKAVYVSHLHADHHIGLVGLLTGRRKVLQNAGLTGQPLFLLAPKQISWWLNMYDRRFENISDEFNLVANGDLILNNQRISFKKKMHLLNNLNLLDVETVLVRHCPNAFGISIKTPSKHKITYSGDTMPCDQLVELGMNSDILIHEATMEDELIGEAKIKMHSTTSQAVEAGKKMNSKYVILTHFSQRYARLPRIPELAENVGIAFDYMTVNLNDLPILPLLYPALKLVFREHCEELEHKAARRYARTLRERDASLNRQEQSSVDKRDNALKTEKFKTIRNTN